MLCIAASLRPIVTLNLDEARARLRAVRKKLAQIHALLFPPSGEAPEGCAGDVLHGLGEADATSGTK